MLSQKGLPVTNTLAYWPNLEVTKKLSVVNTSLLEGVSYKEERKRFFGKFCRENGLAYFAGKACYLVTRGTFGRSRRRGRRGCRRRRQDG